MLQKVGTRTRTPCPYATCGCAFESTSLAAVEWHARICTAAAAAATPVVQAVAALPVAASTTLPNDGQDSVDVPVRETESVTYRRALLRRMFHLTWHNMCKAMMPPPRQLTPEEQVLRQRLLKNAHECVYCGDPATVQDHFRPVVCPRTSLPSGYCGDAWNLVPSCTTCNSSKSNTSWRSFMARNTGKTPRARKVQDLTARVRRLAIFERSGNPQRWNPHIQSVADARTFLESSIAALGRQIDHVQRHHQWHAAAVAAAAQAAAIARVVSLAPVAVDTGLPATPQAGADDEYCIAVASEDEDESENQDEEDDGPVARQHHHLSSNTNKGGSAKRRTSFAESLDDVSSHSLPLPELSNMEADAPSARAMRAALRQKLLEALQEEDDDDQDGPVAQRCAPTTVVSGCSSQSADSITYRSASPSTVNCNKLSSVTSVGNTASSSSSSALRRRELKQLRAWSVRLMPASKAFVPRTGHAAVPRHWRIRSALRPLAW